jgi:Protein of unknown function (DUF3617)
MRTRGAQRLSRTAALSAAAFATLLWAQALQLRPGNYEVLVTSQIQLPPNLAAQTPPDLLAKLQQPQSHQQCITDSDLQHLSKQLADKRTQSDQSCKVASQSIVGGDVKFVLQCAHATVNFAGTFSGDSFKGNMNSSTDHGQHMSASIAAHRIGDCSK